MGGVAGVERSIYMRALCSTLGQAKDSSMKDGQPYAFAGLWEKWKDRAAGADLTRKSLGLCQMRTRLNEEASNLFVLRRAKIETCRSNDRG
jgi:hypothetical protein